jgi:putative transcriptional regulator
MKTLIAPGFLIATPVLRDPNFARTVVLMCLHSPENALGLVINRPSGLSVKRVYEDLGLAVTADMEDRDVMVGGPVQTHQGWVLFTEEGPLGEDDIDVGNGLRLSASRGVLERIANGTGPSRYLLLFGYAGWGPQQLEREIGEGGWIPAEFDEELIFDTPFETRWDVAMASIGVDPNYVSFGSFGDGGGGMEA